MAGWVVVALLVLAALYAVMLYNSLVAKRNQVRNAWAQIDVQLKRRHDLVPNLVETAKGYMKHEQQTLEAVIRARQIAVDAKTVGEHSRAENQLTQTLRSLFAVAENYPDLKANQNMLQLQEELTSTENRIGFARQNYNDTVMRYNNRIEMFPSSVVAGFSGFKMAEYFEIEDAAERKPVAVKF
jgi:LemA protein